MKNIVTVLLLGCCLGACAPGQSYTINTIAGVYPPGDTGAATAALLASPANMAVDSNGNVYFADSSNHKIRKVTPSGQIATIAGTGVPGFSGDGGPATAAQLHNPSAVALDSSGNVYVYDTFNYRVRKVMVNGTITSIAGGSDGNAGDNGPALQAQFAFVGDGGLAVDASGNVYISDTGNCRVRKVSQNNGIITAFAGSGPCNFGGDGQAATAAQMNRPAGLAFDSLGNLYIADSLNNRIRMVSGTSGQITTVAGSANPGSTGDGGAATAATLNNPVSVALDATGNLYIADSNNDKIRMVAIGGTIGTFAGTGTAGFSGDGGTGIAAQLGLPDGVAVDASGNVYIADSANNRIRAVSGGAIRTFAGANREQGDGGPATSAVLNFPARVARDAAGNIYFSDKGNNRVRKITAAGTISTIAGTGSGVASGDGGPAPSAGVPSPTGVAVDSAGDVFIGSGPQVRKIGTDGNINTIAGTPTAGFSGDGGPATSAQLGAVNGLALDSAGNLYIADTTNERIRKVSGGQITTVAGSGPPGSFGGDGGPATLALLFSPFDVTVDGSGNLYITDTVNQRIRQVDSQGTIHTIAGGNGAGSGGDGGAATAAKLFNPEGVAVDNAGNIFIADTFNNLIRRVNSSGIISTIAGTGAAGFSGDGGPATSAQIQAPTGMVLDPSRDIIFADQDNQRIRMLSPPTTVMITSVQTAGGFPNIAQNTWIAVKGVNLAPASVGPNGLLWNNAPDFASGRMPTQLGTVSVTVDGLPAYVYYVSTTQLNVLTPLDNATGPVQIVVTNGTASSPAFTATMGVAAPSFIPINGGNYVFAEHLNGSLMGPPSLSAPGYTFTSAQPGEQVVLYGFGFGLPTTPLTAGSAVQTGTLPSMPAIQIGGSPATVVFAGIISPGLYQFNVNVPATAAGGDNSLRASYGGASTPAGTVLPVQP